MQEVLQESPMQAVSSAAIGSLTPMEMTVGRASQSAGNWRKRIFDLRKRVLILGTGTGAYSLGGTLSHRSPLQYEVVGYVDADLSLHGKTSDGKQILGTYGQLLDIVQAYDVTMIAVCIEGPRGVLPFRALLALKAQGVEIIDGPQLQETLQQHLPLLNVHPSHLVFEPQSSHPRLFGIVKRGIDIVGASILLTLLMPFLAVLICIMKLDSHAPVLTRTLYAGRYGRPFCLLQFRVLGRERLGSSKQSLSHYQRFLERVGRLSHDWHLTALPELFNVLLGRMSFVGPRPVILPVARESNHALSYYRLRERVRPGLFGWAETNLTTAMLPSMTQRELEYDLYYVRHQSLLLDLRVLLRTVRGLLPCFLHRS